LVAEVVPHTQHQEEIQAVQVAADQPAEPQAVQVQTGKEIQEETQLVMHLLHQQPVAAEVELVLQAAQVQAAPEAQVVADQQVYFLVQVLPMQVVAEVVDMALPALADLEVAVQEQPAEMQPTETLDHQILVAAVADQLAKQIAQVMVVAEMAGLVL
jgi:hypothetical protein